MHGRWRRRLQKSLGNADGVKRPKEEALSNLFQLLVQRVGILVYRIAECCSMTQCWTKTVTELEHQIQLCVSVVRTRRLCTCFSTAVDIHMPEPSLISLWMISVFRQRTHGQLVTKSGFFWHHHLKTTLVRETISFWKMLSSASLTTY